MKRSLSSVVRDGDNIERIGPYPALKSSGASPDAEEGRRGLVLCALAALILVVLLSAVNGGGCDHPNSIDYDDAAPATWDGQTIGATLHSGRSFPPSDPALILSGRAGDFSIGVGA